MSKTVKLTIVGPLDDGTFFIHDGENVWDGENWRGFGPAFKYSTFMEAFMQLIQID